MLLEIHWMEPFLVFKDNDLHNIHIILTNFQVLKAIKYFQKKNKNILKYPQIYSCKQLFYCYNLNQIY